MEWLAGKSRGMIVAALLLLGFGCMKPPPEAPAPILSPAAQQEKAAAEQVYATCLLNAAHFMDDGKSDPANIAIVIAPMCYSQFKQLEAASTIGFNLNDRIAFDRAGDQLQLDRATDILHKVRSEPALAANGAENKGR